MLNVPEFRIAEADLGFFFGPAESLLGGHSSMGPMLEYAALYHIPRKERGAPELVTAWHRAGRAPTDQHTPNDDALHRFGRISRRLRDACIEWPQVTEILGAYYGEQGDRWSRTEEACRAVAHGRVRAPGRLGALLQFTVAGKKLIAQQRKKERGAKLKLTDAQRAENAIAAVPTDQHVLLGQAMTEARALLVRGLEVYTGRIPWAEATAAE